MQCSHRMRRAAGDIQVDGYQAVQIADDILTPPKRTSGDGTAAAGDYYLGCWNSFIGRKQSSLHIIGNRSGNMDAVSMPGRSHKINTKALEIKKRCIKNVGICFALQPPAEICLSCRDLPKRFLKCCLECSAKAGKEPLVNKASLLEVPNSKLLLKVTNFP